MRRCLNLATNGLGKTYPNPMVGCVIVNDNKIIGEGWHKKAGEPHAEVNAIDSIFDKSLLHQSVLYVNLEPCHHYGKTPPCADFIIKHKIPKVVVGCLDSHNLVNGKGIDFLRKNGVEVIVNILEKESLEINKRFFTYHKKKRPYIILKWAKTKESFMDINREENLTRVPFWITNTYAQQLSHKLRTEEQAILVGTQTVINDNPRLSARLWKGNQPVRLILDRTLRIPKDSYVYDDTIKTILFSEKNQKPELGNVEVKQIDFNDNNPKNLLQSMYDNNIQSVIVEGGKALLNSFIIENTWDEAHIFEGNNFLKNGLKSPKLEGILEKEVSIYGGDKLRIYKNYDNT